MTGRSDSAGVTPAGWPAEVRPPGAPGWERSAAAWLLDQCPPDYRSHDVLRRHPVVLVRFAAWHLEAAERGARHGVQQVRSELAGLVPPDVVVAALRTLQAEERLIKRRRTELVLVEQALQGARFRAKL